MDFGKLAGSLTTGMTTWGLIGGVLFSGVGFFALKHGRKHGLVKPMALGAALMLYPYFVSNTLLMYLVGAALTAAVFFPRD
jgi:hypothetical protein